MDAEPTAAAGNPHAQADRWVSRHGWWGYRDTSSPLGDLDRALRVLSGESPAEALNERPGSRTLRVPASPGDGGVPQAYLKHTTRSTLSALTHLSGSEALRVRRITRAMRRRGVGVPAVRLAVTRVGPRAVENLVVMDAVEGNSLLDLIDRAAPRDLARGLRLAARSTAELHNAGFAHGDLVPGNLILTRPESASPPAAGGASATASPGVVFIDNDRTRRVWGPWVFRARFRNLSQMVYRLMVADRRRKGTGGSSRIYLKHYLAHAREPAAARLAIRHIVERKARQRLATRRDDTPAEGAAPPEQREK